MGSLTRRHRKAARPEPARVPRGNSVRSVSARAHGPRLMDTGLSPSIADSMAALSLNVNDALADAFSRDGIPRTPQPRVLGVEESAEFRKIITEIHVATQQEVDVPRLLGLFNVELTEAAE